ncbi:unnamed protein product [Ectocarpus sp. 6 AP-2014]
MEALSEVLTSNGSKKWHLPTQEPTLAIGLSFVFLAYFLHPRIEATYQKVRAARAWRAVEKYKRVDVTTYPMVSEVFRGRGKWDAARAVTLLLAAFSLGSWVLELSLEIDHVEGGARLLNLPVPIYLVNQTSLDWQVMPVEEINPEYGRAWLDLDNMERKQAKSTYFVTGYREHAWSKKIETHVDGEIVVASWDSDDKHRAGLYYGSNNTATVDNITCNGTGGDVYLYDEAAWGSFLWCGEGPLAENKTSSQPVIILEKSEGEVSVIVEEVGTHPSFLYSVWTAGSADLKELTYSFHISSTVRLAEAVVTGIVNGETGGGPCFGLLRTFNAGRDMEEGISTGEEERERAKPFGEKPEDDKVDSLQDVETIEVGVLMNTNALVAFVCLLVLSLVGIGWSMCLESSVEMDVYDRDELLRAISQQAQGEDNDPSTRSDMRIYVQKERGGELNVVISASDDDQNGCARFLLRREPTPTVHPIPVADAVSHALDDHGGAPLPLGRPRMFIGSVRFGMGRAYPGRNNNFRYPVALSASPVPSASTTPVPSHAGSLVGTPAPRGRARRGGLPVLIAASPIPSRAAPSRGTPARLRPGSASGTPAAAAALPPLGSSGFLPSFGTGGGTGRRRGAGVGNVGGVPPRGPSLLFDDSVNTFGGGDDDGGSSGGGGEADGDDSADIETGSGGGAPTARTQVSAFGGDDSADIEAGSGGSAPARPQVPAFGGGGGSDVEMGSLELVHPQAQARASSAGDRGGSSSSLGGGSSSRRAARVDPAGCRRSKSDGTVVGGGRW